MSDNARVEFKKEHRYYIIKRKHLKNGYDEARVLNLLEALQLPDIDCVVIESDWPMYHDVWDMIRRYVETGKYESQQREIAAKDAELVRLREELSATNRIITATAGLLQQWEPDYPSDYDKARDIRGEICEIVSEMLDNPTNGIYPTTRCYDRLECLYESQRRTIEQLQSRVKSLTDVANRLAHLHTCSMEGIDNGLPTANDFMAEIDRLHDIINHPGEKEPIDMKINQCGNNKCNEINAGIDKCLIPLITALNAAGLKTVASCCGHGNRPGNIALADGREIMIIQDYKTARMIESIFPDIHGNYSGEQE